MSNLSYYAYANTPIGKMLLIANANRLRGSYWVNQKRVPKMGKTWVYREQMRCFKDFKQQLAEYFRGQRSQFEVDYMFEGTRLQKSTWSQLALIPYGTRVSYKALAQAIALPHAVRAVATAVGYNPLMLVLPCHRVVRSNGKLGGFSAGIGVKQRLLDLEQHSEAEQQSAQSKATKSE